MLFKAQNRFEYKNTQKHGWKNPENTDFLLTNKKKFVFVFDTNWPKTYPHADAKQIKKQLWPKVNTKHYSSVYLFNMSNSKSLQSLNKFDKY